MRPASHMRAGQQVLLTVLFFGALLPGDTVTVKVTPADKTCTVVHLPRWKSPEMGPGDRRYAMDCDYDFRSVDGGILVGGYCRRWPSDKPIYSISKYAVSFGSGHVRRATDGEWEHADPYLNFRVTANNLGLPFKPHQKLIYQGKEFPKSGSTWPLPEGISHISPDGKFLDVNSWDGTIASGFEYDLISNDRLEGHYFVDLYSLTSGRRDLVIEGEFHGVDPRSMFDRSAWISKRYFVLPLDWQNKLRNFIICDVERASAAEANKDGANVDAR